MCTTIPSNKISWIDNFLESSNFWPRGSCQVLNNRLVGILRWVAQTATFSHWASLNFMRYSEGQSHRLPSDSSAQGHTAGCFVYSCAYQLLCWGFLGIMVPGHHVGQSMFENMYILDVSISDQLLKTYTLDVSKLWCKQHEENRKQWGIDTSVSLLNKEGRMCDSQDIHLWKAGFGRWRPELGGGGGEENNRL